jgi:hypothetical protein
MTTPADLIPLYIANIAFASAIVVGLIDVALTIRAMGDDR